MPKKVPISEVTWYLKSSRSKEVDLRKYHPVVQIQTSRIWQSSVRSQGWSSPPLRSNEKSEKNVTLINRFFFKALATNDVTHFLFVYFFTLTPFASFLVEKLEHTCNKNLDFMSFIVLITLISRHEYRSPYWFHWITQTAITPCEVLKKQNLLLMLRLNLVFEVLVFTLNWMHSSCYTLKVPNFVSEISKKWILKAITWALKRGK